LERQAGAILILLPESRDAALSDNPNWPIFEDSLSTVSLPMPIWFAFESNKLDNFYNQILVRESVKSSMDFISGDTYYLSVSIPEPLPIKEFESNNIQVFPPFVTI
jgi:hypothetical protein